MLTFKNSISILYVLIGRWISSVYIRLCNGWEVKNREDNFLEFWRSQKQKSKVIRTQEENRLGILSNANFSTRQKEKRGLANCEQWTFCIFSKKRENDFLVIHGKIEIKKFSEFSGCENLFFFHNEVYKKRKVRERNLFEERVSRTKRKLMLLSSFDKFLVRLDLLTINWKRKKK